MKRRKFIQSSMALAAAASAGVSAISEAKPAKEGIKNYRVLGKTGIKMSDISFGAGRLPSASMMLRAIDRGINYFDTAPDYGSSEAYIGQALKKFKQRDKIFIASKFCHPVRYKAGVSHIAYGYDKAAYLMAVEGSLQRMGTDYLDVVFVHAMGERDDYEGEKKRLLDENMLAAFEELKKAGKVRFLAVSSHGPHNMEKLMTDAVRSGHFDIIMPAFNFMKFPKMPEVLQEAQKRGIGVVAMKTLAGAKDMDLDPKGAVFEHAAFKWVLKHREVGGLVITMKTTRDLDLYMQASGQTFAAADQRALDRYTALYGKDYCRTGCGDCVCPEGVPVASALRYQMYFEDYEDEKRAMQSYSALDKNAGGCSACEEEHCTTTCPYGLPVGQKLRAAHRALSFSAAV
ncbi:MAG: aldo/keto reductase [Gammaproteobacteria bacterium]|nr:aldo/keto reductase [Gammaproteobacteria bacterium]